MYYNTRANYGQIKVCVFSFWFVVVFDANGVDDPSPGC
jgi:hypothetical protein